MKHTKAQPHFDKDLKFGQQYENEFQEAVEGKIECKTDRLCQKTGNVYIETESRGKPSGINTTQSRNYAICLWTQDRTDQVWVLIPFGENCENILDIILVTNIVFPLNTRLIQESLALKAMIFMF